MSWYRRKSENGRGQAALDRAIADWRGNPGSDEVLSGARRARIVEASLDPAHDPAAPASLFLPARRLAVAGVVPVLLGVALALLLGHAGSSQSPRLTVEKRDGQVIFSIANGSKNHYVCKSSVPDRFDCDHRVKVRGTFADATGDGSGIVFYRID